jgi:hypothetical protein
VRRAPDVAYRPSSAAEPGHDRGLLSAGSWLLERWPKVEATFLTAVARGTFELVHLTPADLNRMGELVLQHADFPLGGVDAPVIAVAERFGVDRWLRWTGGASVSSSQLTSRLSPCCRRCFFEGSGCELSDFSDWPVPSPTDRAVVGAS